MCKSLNFFIYMSGTNNYCLINVILVQFQGSKDSCLSKIPMVSCFVPSFFTATVVEHWSVSRTTCCFNLPTWKYWSTQLTVASIFMNLPIIEEIWVSNMFSVYYVGYVSVPTSRSKQETDLWEQEVKEEQKSGLTVTAQKEQTYKWRKHTHMSNFTSVVINGISIKFNLYL